LTVSAKKVESDLKKAKGTGSIEEGKLVSEFIHISQQNRWSCAKKFLLMEAILSNVLAFS
jgi:hypothetical protein